MSGSNKCLNCGLPYKNNKVNKCCGSYKFDKCCENPIQDNKENREKFKKEEVKNA